MRELGPELPQHTPGPGDQVMTPPMTIQDQGADGYVVLDSNGNFYARTYSSLDARLIAQATAMLEVLRRILSQHCEHWEVIDGLNQRVADCLCAACQDARAILRAMEGDK